MHLELVTTFVLDKLRNELSPDFKYHCVEHTKDVFDAAERIARLENDVSDQNMLLLLTAALFHDTGFLVSPINHEINSCHFAREHLPNHDYNDVQIHQICALIMATKVPQKPKDHLQQIICDADLDYLGRDDFFEISEKLYEEMVILGNVSSREEFLNAQLHFFKAHRYFTSTASKLRNGKKQEHLNTIKKIYSDTKNI